jgi:hypothetical protein
MKQPISALVTAVFLIAFVNVCRAEESMSGRWEGSVQIPDHELTLVVDLAQGDNGAWTGSVILPGFNVKGTAVNDLVVKGSEVSFAFTTGRGLHATLKGNVGSDGKLSGDFSEEGNTAPFVLTKIGPAQVEPPSRNTPITKELEGNWTGQFEVYGMPIKVSIKLSNHGNDPGAAEFIVIGRKTNTLPVSLVSQQGSFVIVESHEAGISYEGKFNSGSGEIKGFYTQATIEVPLVLRRQK